VKAALKRGFMNVTMDRSPPNQYREIEMRLRHLLIAIISVLLGADRSRAQDYDLQLRNDRKTFQNSSAWHYDDLSQGIARARETHKPLLVVFRCVPCKACQKFDDDVARRDPIIRDLLDEFVCIRIPQANNIDLSHFQFDFDLSFAVFFMDADLLIYGRFGTRSERPEVEDISLEGLRKAMREALRIHRNRADFTAALTGKQAKPARFKMPREYPAIAARFQDVGGDAEVTAKSCIHCHQVRDAERRLYRAAGEPIPENVVFPYPDPSTAGLELNPSEMAKVERVLPNSPALRAGFKPGDEFVALEDQPLLSIADVQWVLHNAPSAATLTARVRRNGVIIPLTLTLESGWRRGNISWRTTTWPLREMAFGGMKLEPLKDEERRGAGLPPGRMALKVAYVFEYGERIAAKRAGLKKGDIIISYDGKDQPMTESELLGYSLGHKRPGDSVSMTYLRDGTQKTVLVSLP
jgi:serine protease Do